jgi:hypothetical protein
MAGRTSILACMLQECSFVLAEQTLPAVADMRLTDFMVMIVSHGAYLSYDHNALYFSLTKKTHWIIERTNDDATCYVRAAIPLPNGEKYIGCPNLNNRLYLYTSNNRFTRWTIRKNHAFHAIHYAGEKWNPDEVSLVVARYDEDVRWVAPYNDIACIYNKGADNIRGLVDRITSLDNVGREGHTYLHHMIEHYDTLTNKTIFMQGDPFIHNNTVLYGIDNYERLDALQPMGLVYMRERNIPPPEIEDRCSTRTAFGLHYAVYKIDANCAYHSENSFQDCGIEDMIVRYKHTYQLTDIAVSCNIPENGITAHFLDRCKYNKPREAVYPMTFCALFAVNKDIIHRNTIDTYGNIRTALLDKHPQGGESGYVLERLWLYLFDYKRG